jgi:SAM-dependent methyltransferase
MNAPFDMLASSYAALWSDSAEGRTQRQQVWDSIDPIFAPGSAVLDFGCGTGDDALHLSERGIIVEAIDASPRMVEIAKGRGAAARILAIEDLAQMEAVVDTVYGGALSNFGALNCVTDLHPVARGLARLLAPGSPLAVCVMGRFYWRESLRFIAALDFARAARRWRGRTLWRGMEVRYWSARQIDAAFAPHFQRVGRVPIGGGDHHLYILRRRVSC